MRLKQKAAEQRKSLAAVIRVAAAQIIESEDQTSKKQQAGKELVEEFRKMAKSNAKYVKKGFDSTKALREIRYSE